MNQITKHLIKFIQILIISLFILPQDGYSQIPCKDVYIWDFCWDNDYQNNLTKNLTLLFESEFTNYSECVVLQRRNFAKLKSHENNEKSIHKIENPNIKDIEFLKTIGAKIVVFGILRKESVQTDNVILTLSFENIFTKQVIYSSSILFTSEQIGTFTKQKEVIQFFLSQNIYNDKVSNSEPHKRDETFLNQQKENSSEKNNQSINWDELNLYRFKAMKARIDSANEIKSTEDILRKINKEYESVKKAESKAAKNAAPKFGL